MSLGSALQFLQQQQSTSEKASSNKPPPPPLHIAIQGCGHGELDRIYAECRDHESRTGKKIDLLICCGDFQSVRNTVDLESMAVPPKYRAAGDFPKYARGDAVAPVLTLFIGGNHEASNLLFEQYYGGFVAENIYYLGHSGVVNVGGLRIAGLSGIFKGHDYLRPYPVPPYPKTDNMGPLKSAYHVRKFEMDKMAMLHQSSSLDNTNKNNNSAPAPIDVFLSHDWPCGITSHGDEEALLKIKPYFADDIRNNVLGNPHSMDLLKLLKPRYWFAAHLHCRFRALVHHDGASGSSGASINNNNNNNIINNNTNFLALNKCVRSADEFLEFIDIIPAAASSSSQAAVRNPFTGMLAINVDPQWCEIIKKTHHFVPVERPPPSHNHHSSGSQQVEWLAASLRRQQQQTITTTRRDRNDGDDNSSTTTTTRQQDAVSASDTMGLLRALRLVGDVESEEVSEEKSHQHRHDAAPTAAFASSPSSPSQTAQTKQEDARSKNEGKTAEAKPQESSSTIADHCGWSECV